MGKSRFGKISKGERLARIKRSSNYRDGKFQNKNHTPELAEGENVFNLIYEKLFKKFPNTKPINKIPSTKTDLHQLDPAENILVWFGHSSYFLQIDGIRILVDPVLSGNASPVAKTVSAFMGTDVYSVSDFPKIDYLFISHDHYDHLDYKTIIALKDKVEQVICGLGVGAHFESWGYDAKVIIEKDWHEKLELKNGITLYIESSRHFSGRALSRNKSLWVSFVLHSKSTKIYLGGDSGYDQHFSEIGEKYGPFDLVILENGQYNKSWPYIHLTPDEVIKAANDLKAKRIFPVHSSKFALSNHPWDEPLKRLSALTKSTDLTLVTPIIGEKLNINNKEQKFTEWWLNVQ
ncbi:MBL fold metallo-hydrolase [Brumimicrobium mesophilum]|uniref:MBL fold metallo-hydrolase n=1 Tax=Brumimicrobium mesophilum TaxID=392717 RepID=UPI000D13FB87|nr:MBL fold metallo-hydrolase [Brumimicrobium mesophilum]